MKKFTREIFIKKTKMERNTSLDWIRLTALLNLISFHFFYYIEFYNAPVVGINMFLLCALRSLFTTCIPLFLLLTGYLMCDKVISRGYYKKCLRTVWVYVLASLTSEIYRYVVGGTRIDLYAFLKAVFNFTACPYAWYVELYLGLFLLIPFLNILYQNVPSKAWKIGMIMTTLVMTALPSVLNVYRFDDLQWWRKPLLNRDYFKLVPAWWVGMYPITYYFIGAYIHEYGIKIKRVWNILGIAMSMLVFGAYGYWRSTPGAFDWGLWTDWSSLPNVVLGVLVFSLLLNCNYKSNTNKLVLSWITKCVFGAYLLSWIAEDVIYHHLLNLNVEVAARIIYYPLVLLILAASLVLSSAVNLIYEFAHCMLKRERIRYEYR